VDSGLFYMNTTRVMLQGATYGLEDDIYRYVRRTRLCYQN